MPLYEHIMALPLALTYFCIKHTVWGEAMYIHEAAYVVNWKILKSDWKKTFEMLLFAFPSALLGSIYSRSRKIGNIVYDSILTINGILFYAFIYNLTGDLKTSLYSLALFYIIICNPAGTLFFVEPEFVGDFFTLCGLNLSLYGIANNDPKILFLAGLTAGIAVLIKLSLFTHIAPIITAIFIAQNKWQAAYIFAGTCTIYSVIFIAFAMGELKFNSGFMKLIYEWIAGDAKQRQTTTSFAAKLLDTMQDIPKYFILHFPITMLALCYFASTEQVTNIDYMMLCFGIIAVSCTICRMFYASVYIWFIAIPLSFFAGSALALTFQNEIHSYIALAIIFMLSAIQMKYNFRHSGLKGGSIRNYQNDVSLYKYLIEDRLKDTIQENTSLFNRTHLTNFYTFKECNFPHNNLLSWGDRVERTITSTAPKAQLAHFFKESTPDFILLMPGREFDLNLFEKVYKAQYELFFIANYLMLYKKSSQQPFFNIENFDIAELFKKNEGTIARHTKDKNHLIQNANALLQQYFKLKSSGDHNKSLNCLKISWMLCSDPNTGILLLKELKQHGDMLEANKLSHILRIYHEMGKLNCPPDIFMEGETLGQKWSRIVHKYLGNQ